MPKLKSSLIRDVAFSLIVAIVISLLLCLVFSALVKGLMLEESAVNIGRTVIKTVSILISALIGFKSRERGAIKGIILGVSYSFISFVLFTALTLSLDFSAFNLLDSLFCGISGAISGIIAVNFKK